MAKNKDIRILIVLECIKCRKTYPVMDQYNTERCIGISRYFSTKNRRNNPERIQLKKFCCICKTHTLHNEVK